MGLFGAHRLENFPPSLLQMPVSSSGYLSVGGIDAGFASGQTLRT
jgi:hypothetical protein